MHTLFQVMSLVLRRYHMAVEDVDEPVMQASARLLLPLFSKHGKWKYALTMAEMITSNALCSEAQMMFDAANASYSTTGRRRGGEGGDALMEHNIGDMQNGIPGVPHPTKAQMIARSKLSSTLYEWVKVSGVPVSLLPLLRLTTAALHSLLAAPHHRSGRNGS